MTHVLKPGLYVVATPIGNLEDMSPRAERVLREAAIVAAEDTRTSRLLLTRAGSEASMVSLTEHNVESRIPALLEAAARSVVALVSDAGTPVVADPGGRLVAAAHSQGIAVVAIPGPSALAAAISAAGFDGSDVHFIGFLPKTKGERQARLKATAAAAEVLVFFESPTRLGKALLDVSEALGDPEVVVCRELTKLHEEIVRGHASELAQRFATTRGECTVVVRCPAVEPSSHADDEIAGYMAEMQRAGARRAGAAAEAVRRFGVSRDMAYGLWDRDE
ncbi:MAG: 16S rRNA (cytidine(1402)-2'-O)-methyltransferase [bacterium]